MTYVLHIFLPYGFQTKNFQGKMSNHQKLKFLVIENHYKICVCRGEVLTPSGLPVIGATLTSHLNSSFEHFSIVFLNIMNSNDGFFEIFRNSGGQSMLVLRAEKRFLSNSKRFVTFGPCTLRRYAVL